LRPDAPPGESTLDAAAIAEAAADLRLQLGPDQWRALEQYAALLQRWNTVHNLTAIESPAQVLTHHLLDSLAIVTEVRRLTGGAAARVLDVGSGGGLPGIPLAIAAPEVHVTLVDKVRKKIAFLAQAKLELRLANVEAIHTRVEALQAAPFNVIIARAVASLIQLVRLTRHLLAANGWWCAMKGALPRNELDELKREIPDAHVDVIGLRVPRLNAARHLILMRDPHAAQKP
jgi:16S rRNA (guanine527-N7)-methyltransferase